MNKQELIKKLEEQIYKLNPKYGKDIIFGINIAIDIIKKSELEQ